VVKCLIKSTKALPQVNQVREEQLRCELCSPLQSWTYPWLTTDSFCCVLAVSQSIDLRGLLLSLHAFFEVLGVEEIRRRSHADDKPLRMVKTILHELCKLKGTEIYK
jgi:hypothetical protein